MRILTIRIDHAVDKRIQFELSTSTMVFRPRGGKQPRLLVTYKPPISLIEVLGTTHVIHGVLLQLVSPNVDSNAAHRRNQVELSINGRWENTIVDTLGNITFDIFRRDCGEWLLHPRVIRLEGCRERLDRNTNFGSYALAVMCIELPRPTAPKFGILVFAHLVPTFQSVRAFLLHITFKQLNECYASGTEIVIVEASCPVKLNCSDELLCRLERVKSS